MNRGRSRQLLALGVGTLVLFGVGGLVLQRVTRGDAYATAAAATARIERDQFDAYFTCALPGTPPSRLSAQRVHSAFEKLGDRAGKSYARTLASCSPQLQGLSASVQALQVPAEVKPQHARLVAAAGALAAADTQYLRYLTDGARSYDPVVVMPMHERFGAAWGGYRTAQADLEQALRDRL